MCIIRHKVVALSSLPLLISVKCDSPANQWGLAVEARKKIIQIKLNYQVTLENWGQ